MITIQFKIQINIKNCAKVFKFANSVYMFII